MEAIDLKLGKTLYGTKSTKPRWQKCLRLTNNCKISILTDLKKHINREFSTITSTIRLPQLKSSF